MTVTSQPVELTWGALVLDAPVAPDVSWVCETLAGGATFGNPQALIASGHAVMIGTAAAPSNRHATWNVSYQKDGGKDGGILVLVDANTGKVEKVLK